MGRRHRAQSRRPAPTEIPPFWACVSTSGRRPCKQRLRDPSAFGVGAECSRCRSSRPAPGSVWNACQVDVKLPELRGFGGRGLNRTRQPQGQRAASSVLARYWRDLPLARLPQLMHIASANRRASWHPGRIGRRLQALVAVTSSHHERQARVVAHHAGPPVPGAWNRRTPACVRTSSRTRPDLAFIAIAH